MLLKRVLIGPALRSEAQPAQLLPKWIALPVFCSDPISSVAYATEQILLVAGLGGAAYLWLASPVAVAVVALLAIVVLSYRQICYAYPNGGGAFVVSQHNLGEKAALTAAAALLVDYVMTVAVSVVAGVLAITSKFPGLQPHAAELSVAVVAVLAAVNLRGLNESGKAFAFPTYAFIVLVFLLLATAAYQAMAGGGLKLASGAVEHLTASQPVGGYLTVLLALRAFASGCTALTGVEAISNGVPAFRKPKSRNAAITLMIMGGLAIAMFTGITILAERMKARAYPDGFPSVISQLGAGVWGSNSPVFLAFQLATAAILILAANTAFNGFPVLASILAQNRYLPRQLHHPRRPARLQQRDPVARRLRDRVDHRIQRQHRQTDPALHHRRVHLVHAQSGRNGAALAATDRRPSTPCAPAATISLRASDQCHRCHGHRRRGRSS